MAVSTFRTDPDPETGTVDGLVQFHSGGGKTWSEVRDGAGTGFNDDGVVATVWMDSGPTTDKWQQINRTIFLFDTSSIPDTDVIQEAKFSIYVSGRIDNLNLSIALVKPSPASNTALADSDYDIANWDMTYQSDQTPTIASLTVPAYYDFTLNAAGLANINKTGVTALGVVMKSDADNVAPPWIKSVYTTLQIDTADKAGTDKDPYLQVTHGPDFLPQSTIKPPIN